MLHDLSVVGISQASNADKLSGRASPCQGEGQGFESLHPFRSPLTSLRGQRLATRYRIVACPRASYSSFMGP